MKEMRMGEIETRFAQIIWQNEPITTGELIRLSEQELGWNRSTTYTVLKRLCEKGIFQNQNSTVTSLLSESEFFALQSEKFVEETFDGSLPAFLLPPPLPQRRSSLSPAGRRRRWPCSAAP